MTLRDIITILSEDQLCQNWDLEENSLTLFYENYELHLIYDESLYCIFTTSITNRDFHMDLKSVMSSRTREIYIFDDHFCIQTRYKRFTTKILFNSSELMKDIAFYLDILKDDKKNIFLYSHKNINEEINPKSNYPIPNIE